jgi:hypothetical protein
MPTIFKESDRGLQRNRCCHPSRIDNKTQRWFKSRQFGKNQRDYLRNGSEIIDNGDGRLAMI